MVIGIRLHMHINNIGVPQSLLDVECPVIDRYAATLQKLTIVAPCTFFLKVPLQSSFALFTFHHLNFTCIRGMRF